MSLTYRQLMDELTRLIKSRSSGTLFIHSDCNHAITFTLKSGQITALYFGPRKGRRAIPMTLGISGGTCHFDETELARVPQDLPPTPEIMAQLQPSAMTEESTPGSLPEEVRYQILQELQQILTENLGPIANLIFEETLGEMDTPCATEDSFQHLIQKLSLNIEPGEITRFHDQVAEVFNKKTRN